MKIFSFWKNLPDNIETNLISLAELAKEFFRIFLILIARSIFHTFPFATETSKLHYCELLYLLLSQHCFSLEEFSGIYRLLIVSSAARQVASLYLDVIERKMRAPLPITSKPALLWFVGQDGVSKQISDR